MLEFSARNNFAPSYGGLAETNVAFAGYLQNTITANADACCESMALVANLEANEFSCSFCGRKGTLFPSSLSQVERIEAKFKCQIIEVTDARKNGTGYKCHLLGRRLSDNGSVEIETTLDVESLKLLGWDPSLPQVVEIKNVCLPGRCVECNAPIERGKEKCDACDGGDGHDDVPKEKLTNPLEFILAGKATFTVQNTETQNRFTYKVERKTENLHFVSIMTGPSNTNDFTYLGSIRNKVYKHGRKSDIKGSAQSAIVFEWLWAKLMKGDLPEEVAIFHEGRCGRCGRKLTTPESVTAGFGPHCAKEIGISSPVTLSSGDTELSKVSGHETDLEPTVAK